jgi:histone acetyltransferase 1
MTGNDIDPHGSDIKEKETEENDGRISSAASCILFSIPRHPCRCSTDTGTATDGSSTVKEEEEEEDNIESQEDTTSTTGSASTSSTCYEFHPVYTHQIFPNEYIPNYHPIVTSSASSPYERQHSSFQYPTQYGLLIQIRLLPSCASCHVDITVQLPSNESNGEYTNDGNDEAEENNDAIPQLQQPSFKKRKIDACYDMNIPESIHSILWTKLQPFLPPILQWSVRLQPNPMVEEYTAMNQLPSPPSPIPLPLSLVSLSKPYFEQPYGTILHEYTHPATNTTSTHFCITIGHGTEEGADFYFHRALQKLAFYYIENASEVNINDPSWKVLYVFQKHTTSVATTKSTTTATTCDAYSFVGYMTLYHFENPFRKPCGGTIVRICQVLILPPYQRQKHGQQMLHTLYQYYDTDTQIVEINVEDPVPAFTYVRLLVDYERFLHHFPDGFQSSNSSSTTVTIQDEAFFRGWNNVKMISHFQSILKITSVQIQMIYEIDKLRQLQQYCSKESTESDGDDDRMALFTKRYRLMVKQRLYEQNKESLDEQNRKQQLDIMYRELEQQYKHILSKTNTAMT